ncbi:MAG TPA: hypothetical protein DEG17_04315 [Cyanobacteria bacterium UBA11149]|nr:hypothetical protein [Cyanobacteria bacterium UBA11367]HBE61009.1 hypothetical protein [Cyanobacteria bacterium UBA11366]HBK65961.1 hypothetical protein [Cyanobacteria bacterium UBA11166]HBR74295.1 hypothetical protein [Cyanobacteria bacterium UBA11159]HBS69327.1 hypothetical protein [Cyanobacteria bacterium UBA11153]HBW88114.1 hypothetical protein [Cyanobacteria bacterium UBA11149]HCA93221.1 hypothetical protein [Cyanobacteria bacterium UBA9226]
MFDWIWLSRVTLLGLAGIGCSAALLLPFLPENHQNYRKNSDVNLENIPSVTKAVVPPPLPVIQRQIITKKAGNKVNQAPPFNLQESWNYYASLFATPTSLGMVAIGVAEGNYRLVLSQGNLYVQYTKLYFGHTDPGNLSWGEVVTNYGPCSDQGRSGGNINAAEQWCLQRALSQLPTQLMDLNAAGINPNTDIEAVLNAADLYNQAKPIHSRYFPQALVMARRGGKTGIEALAWARTASFYLNANGQMDLQTGQNQASGLIGICARENRPVTEWECVYGDQLRRVKAIADVLDKYRQIYQR